MSAPNISITGEFTFFPLPQDIVERYKAKYYDFDLYGTVNFTDYFGAQGGYRSFDVFYHFNEDEGDLRLGVLLRRRSSVLTASARTLRHQAIRIATHAPRNRVSRLPGFTSPGRNPADDVERHERGARCRRSDRDVDAPLLARRQPQGVAPRPARAASRVVDRRVPQQQRHRGARLVRLQHDGRRRARRPPRSRAGSGKARSSMKNASSRRSARRGGRSVRRLAGPGAAPTPDARRSARTCRGRILVAPHDQRPHVDREADRDLADRRRSTGSVTSAN